MVPETQAVAKKSNHKKILLFSILGFTLLMLITASIITYKVLSMEKVYNGVYVNGINASNLSKQDLEDLLKKSFETVHNNEIYITLKSGEMSEKFSLSEIGAAFDIPSAVEKAYEVGRSGNFIKRLLDIVDAGKNNVSIRIPMKYDQGKIDDLIGSISKKILSPKKDSELVFKGDKVIFVSGHQGKTVHKDELNKKLNEAITALKTAEIELPVVEDPVKKADVDKIFSEINQDAKDATLSVNNGQPEITDHKDGRKIDKTTLASIIEEAEKTENAERVIPVTIVKPKITTENLKANLFKDDLGTFTTGFSTSSTNDANRGVNIRLAVSKINGKILLPGDEFSFNKTVGPRSAAGGYKVAHTFVGGKVVDGIGGGICQVSSTLYNSVLFSDLNVTQRINHMFAVGYVPKGRDAAVSYPDVDLKFKNTSNYPIKIVGTVTNRNQIVFSVRGTKESTDKTIEIVPKILKTLNFTTTYIDDAKLPEGKNITLHEGKTGYIVDTYKIVKVGGKVISDTKLHTSRYNVLNKEVKRGTKKSSQPSTTPASSKTTPAPASKPSAPSDTEDSVPASTNPELLDDIPAQPQE